jgi:uroporphyrinogen-III synthase
MNDANQHKHILVTQPGERGLLLCQLIVRTGRRAMHFPTIAFAPPRDLHAFKLSLFSLQEQEWAIFVSKQAVFATLSMMRELNLSFPETLKLAAVGGVTAKVLQQVSGRDVLYPKDNWHTEGLLALPSFQAVDDKKIAIIRGEGGLLLLDKTLAKRSAKVSPVIAYRRTLPTIDVKPCLDAIQRGCIQAIICLSFEAVCNLQTLLNVENQSRNPLQLLNKIPLIVASERIKSLARNLGFQTICVARNGSEEALFEVLSTYLESVD